MNRSKVRKSARHNRPPKINKFPERSQSARDRALHVLARMRRTGETLTAASREQHTDPRTVRKYIGVELRAVKQGQVQPTKVDQRVRKMLIPVEDGLTPVSIRGSKDASLLGRYMSAVGRYLASGDTSRLKEFEGLSLAGRQLITNPDALSSLAQAGALQLDQIYALPGSSS